VSFLGGAARIVILSVVVGALLYGALRFTGLTGSAEDYSGPGTGSVEVSVPAGATGVQIGEALEQAGVVKTAEAFYQESLSDDRSSMIQPGTYRLRKQMSSEAAIDALLDRVNRIETRIVVPEGSRVSKIVAAIVKGSDISEDDLEDALGDPEAIGLPDEANGNPEGYLFPATYTFSPNDKPVDMLSAMVARYEQALGDNDIEAIGPGLGAGYTPEQIMTVASLVEAEGRGDDMFKIARAIYNRLELPGGGGTNGLLQIDAAVLYALGTRDTSKLVAPLADLTDSPYNTYRFAGLPPGPIGAPGEKAIQAALRPAEGPWVYWVAVDCEGTTKFSTTLEDHNQYEPVNGDDC
jgi:UPF0755 protein